MRFMIGADSTGLYANILWDGITIAHALNTHRPFREVNWESEVTWSHSHMSHNHMSHGHIATGHMVT